MKLEGSIALVTGASRGLGRAIATELAAEGAFVFITYRRREEGARETLELVRAAGSDGAALRVDLRDRASIRAAVDHVLIEKERLDVLVNNAAVVRDQPFLLMDDDAWSEVIDANLSGTAAFCRAAAHPMLARRSGSIVNVASIVGLHASAGQANYAASKGGLIALTRTLAVELAPRGVRVNAVAPGLLTVGMAERLDRRVVDRTRERIPLGRLGDGREVARIVAFLASDEASYVVGQTWVVDGGLTL